MVYRIFVEKKPAFAHEANGLLADIRSFLGIKSLERLRVFNRYDVDEIEESLFKASIDTIFSEPQLDQVYETLPVDESLVFATEYLPGQFDQRADSAAQCIQLAFRCERPRVRTAHVYMLYGNLSAEDVEAIKKYVINPVESREASLETVETLALQVDVPTEVKTLTGFTALDEAGLAGFIKEYGLAMDLEDIKFCQKYFIGEHRDPTLTEIRMIDTYWSDHCRHTTFLTEIESVTFEDVDVQAAWERYLNVRKELGRTKPISLMDIGTIGAKYLVKTGKLTDLDESEEINACTVKMDVQVGDTTEKWLLLFKNETHNHPTEIEPFGGAATCIGGAIRDPLSGRSYVYQAMRVTGGADPLRPVEKTLKGKLPQRKLVTTAAAGYSSYGNQIGLATGLVDEIYHDGYAAKRLEIGAVVGAAPAANVRREVPAPGDVVVLLGGRTGRDGIGGATGSSKSHNLSSVEQCGAEVQKGNAPEERKLQRLFRNGEASRLIKRCNDFGAGGVSVAIGELADGLEIDLNAVPKKYEGLDGTELAISESQERMAVVLAPEDVARFVELAGSENLEATVVAHVTEEPRLVMHWNGKEIVDISREFLNSNGAPKHTSMRVSAGEVAERKVEGDFAAAMRDLAGDLNVCSRRGLSERFDASIGAGTVLMPFGGSRQLTPPQAMVAKVPVPGKNTRTCSAMAYGFNPQVMEKSPYRGAYLAVVESVAKLVATGAGFENAHLTFQEYFERMNPSGMSEEAIQRRWGKPLSALLGALDAQLDLGIAAIGGKDSMSGTFEDIDVPPTLVSFAVSVCDSKDVISPEFKKAGSRVALLVPECGENGLPKAESLKANFKLVTEMIREGKILSAYTPVGGGIAEGILKMAIGNGIGFAFENGFDMQRAFGYLHGAFVMEMAEGETAFETIGHTTEEKAIAMGETKVCLCELEKIYNEKLEPVFPVKADQGTGAVEAFSYKAETRVAPKAKIARPRVLIPVFPGTNCEYDTAEAFEHAGAVADIVVINNLTADGVTESARKVAEMLGNSQILFVPGGFSGGDEPDGSGKFITAFLRNPMICDAITALPEKRDGLVGGICNGFQALVKLGLVPYGKITEPNPNQPTLTFNVIGRHQSRLVRTRVASNKSPWLANCNVGDIHLTPISHGEGRFIVSDAELLELVKNGQIATQYVDENGTPTMDILHNPNGSVAAIEGITSPDGRVFGKMAHSERKGLHLYKNVPGNIDNGMFVSAVEYYR